MNTKASPDRTKTKEFFEPTVWTTILEAQQGGEETRLAALSQLMGRYRRPIIVQIRHVSGCGELEAEELAHAFLAHWMSKDLLRSVDPQRGRFRTFVKDCIRNFLIDVHRKKSARKRRPEEPLESIDSTPEEGGAWIQPPDEGLGPDEAVDAAWAQSVFLHALASLERECVSSRRGKLFAALKPQLSGDPEAAGQIDVARRLGVSHTALRTAFHRLKQRLGELIRQEVKQGVGSQEDWEDELRYLIQVLGK